MLRATRRFARANNGITASDKTANTIPGKLRSGASRNHKVLTASKPT
jgi:hypothetical protein